jgi:hypothetical protein
VAWSDGPSFDQTLFLSLSRCNIYQLLGYAAKLSFVYLANLHPGEFFHQDGTQPPYSFILSALSWSAFPNRCNVHGFPIPWPTTSPATTPCDFSSCGNIRKTISTKLLRLTESLEGEKRRRCLVSFARLEIGSCLNAAGVTIGATRVMFMANLFMYFHKV